MRSAVALVTSLVVVLGAGCTGARRETTPRSGERHGLDAAALPFRVLRARGGEELAFDAFVAELGRARAVCIGESHRNPHHHWVQLRVLEELGGEGKALGMEMFQRPFQGVLDDFAAGRIDEPTMLSRTGWAERWGYDFALYRPLVRLAVERRMKILALNAPTELTRKVARQGLGALLPEERAQVPDLDLEDAAHREWFRQATEGHGMPSESFENFYTAQVIWDETMAETVAAWLAGDDDRRAVILAGQGHCIDAGIPRRLRRRGAGEVVSVQPVIDDGQGAVADLLVRPENDFLVVMTPPAH